jgi:DNA polymerase-3 subunit delta'
MLLGHEEAWRDWRGAVAGGRMHHAWILAGPRGLGKATFAGEAAGELTATPGGQVMAVAAHPDILVLTPLPDSDEEERKRAEGKRYKAKRNISVEQIRGMQRRLTTRPTLGAHRAVIIDAADDLEKGAFNALLKSLEEPPQGTVFLLVAHRLGRLPATIRSRCRLLRFPRIDDDAVGTVLDAQGRALSGEARGAAMAVAQGSPGVALELAGYDLGDAFAVMSRIVAQGDPDLALRGALVAAIGPRPDRERLLAALETARAVLLQALPTAPRHAAERLIEAHQALGRLTGEVPTANFEPAVLMLEIGGLLASAAADREAA